MTTLPTTAEPRGALVRVPTAGRHWVERIPPVPKDRQVTVSFTAQDAFREHGDALAELGYRLAGIGEHPGSVAAADFLVGEQLIHERPAWWRALCQEAERVFNLALGPVQTTLADVLRAHAAAAGRTVAGRQAPGKDAPRQIRNATAPRPCRG